MSKLPLTPTRKKQLEAYIRLIRRTESSITAAGHIVRGATYRPESWQRRSALVRRLVTRLRADPENKFITAWLCLQIARSKFAAELEGLEWKA